MANVTTSSYPVITVSKAGDQFVVVQDGNVKKLTRTGLTDLISSLVKDTVISLDDTPGSYVGQQGKVLVVNPTEDGLEFEFATSGNWLSLSDTPGSYAGQAGKLPVVNPGETGLEFVLNDFVDLIDTPNTFTGASEKVVRVNAGETALEFVTAEVASPRGVHTGGWFDIDNNSGTQVYTTTGTFVTLINDAAGPNTRSDFAPPGITDVYDEINNEFDFSQLSVGDQVMIRVDITIETTTANQEVAVDALFDNGGSPFRLALSRNGFKTSGAGKQITPELRFYIGSDAVKNNPVEIQLRSDGNTNIDLRGYAVFVTRQGPL